MLRCLVRIFLFSSSLFRLGCQRCPPRLRSRLYRHHVPAEPRLFPTCWVGTAQQTPHQTAAVRRLYRGFVRNAESAAQYVRACMSDEAQPLATQDNPLNTVLFFPFPSLCSLICPSSCFLFLVPYDYVLPCGFVGLWVPPMGCRCTMYEPYIYGL